MRTGLWLLAVLAVLFTGTSWSTKCLAENPVPFEALYRQAYEIRLRQLGPEHPDTIASLVRLGALLRAHGRAEDSEALHRKALEAQSQSGLADEGTLIELAETLAVLGRNEEAEDLYSRSLESTVSHVRRAHTLLRIAAIRQAREDSGGARQAFLGALKHFEEGRPLADDERQARATALNDLGLLLEAEGDLDDAVSTYRQSADTHAEVFGTEHPATAAARANLAGMLATRGESVAAVALLERAVPVMQAAYGPRHDDTARLRNRLGEIYEVLGRLEEAKAEYLAALAAWQPPSLARGLALADLGRLAGVQGDLGAAKSMLEEAVGLLQPGRSVSGAELAEALDSYGSTLRALGSLNEAEGVLRKALALRERVLGASHSDVALTLVGLAGVLHLRGELTTAEPLYRRALKIQEETLGPAHAEVGETLYNLAHLAKARGDTVTARDGFERSFEILSRAYGTDDPFVSQIRAELQALR